MSPKRSAVVAGGGIGGLAAAAALAGAGTEVTVIERTPSINDVGSGLMLYANGVRAAGALSARLGERIRTDGWVTPDDAVRLLMDSTGAVLSKEPIGQAGTRLGAPQIPILRTALQNALFDEAAAAGATVLLNTTVEDYTADDASVSVRLSDGTTRTADLLIAADGIKSALRQRMLGDGPPQYRGYTSVRGRTTGSALCPQPFVANGRGIQLFAAPVGNDTMYWAAKITAEAGQWPAMGRETALRTLLERLADWHAPVAGLIREADPDDVAVTDIHDRDPAPYWADGRVALLGDAAHPMVPALGQGANTALEDAVVLAAALRAHPGADEVATALKAYERERIGRVSAVVLHSRRQGSLDQGASQAQERARNDFMKSHGRKDEATPGIVAWTPEDIRLAAADSPLSAAQ
ncbi:FAD-dependent monooxygenase [Streptomyces decoyicus]|uniref:FAD-dependent monooxygenase n=1 Tax=Streptomyces decoyicus TaxID=249567 RepID=UPI000662AEEE|nr:FAD-dependent monooxygenase [Streptomyces decoyicus]